MSKTRFVIPALACLLGTLGLSTTFAAGAQQQQLPSREYVQESSPWDAPPSEWQEIQRRGFHDGIEGARRDFGNHRNPNVNNREEYLHPDLPRELREPYREGFRRGYERGMSHLMGDPGRPSPGPEHQFREPVRESWDAMPSEWREFQRSAFRDGIDGAHKDYGNHRRPDPNNRDEYRHPHVPYGLQNDYREAFRRGYERAMAHLTGEYDRR
ncbi:MAG TPA: hypothetical protein VGG85_16525 [Terracidiphilus sp.]|jgi:hypothetical protein